MSVLGRHIAKKIFINLLSIVIILGGIFYVLKYTTILQGFTDKIAGMYQIYKGDKCYQKHDLQCAIDRYNRGLELYPEHYEAWFNLGNIYVVYEDYYAACDAYNKAIENNKKYTEARMNLGIVSTEKLGDFDEAISQYNEIVNSKNKLWFIPFIFNNKKSEKINKGLAYYNMGVAYRAKSFYENEDIQKSISDLKNAIEAYKKAIKILKNDYDSIYNLALAYHLMGNTQDAGKYYCEAINIQPMNYEAHYNLAILLRHLKMYKEAYREIEKASLLISNKNSNSNTKSYVFDILNYMSQTLVMNDDYKYLVENDGLQSSTSGITYVNGKIVATEKLDEAMLNNFRNCEVRDSFNKDK